MKAIVVLVTVVTATGLCVAAQLGDPPVKQPQHCIISAEEQSIVVAYFNTPALSKNMLGFRPVATMLANMTQAAALGLDLDYINLELAAKGRAIPADARNDFSRKARENCGVGLLSGLRGVRVISAPEGVSLPAFHRRFGKDAVLIRVSRVGFNREGTVAVLHVSYHAQHSGGGCLYVFERRAGRWIKKTELPSWTT